MSQELDFMQVLSALAQNPGYAAPQSHASWGENPGVGLLDRTQPKPAGMWDALQTRWDPRMAAAIAQMGAAVGGDTTGGRMGQAASQMLAGPAAGQAAGNPGQGLDLGRVVDALKAAGLAQGTQGVQGQTQSGLEQPMTAPQGGGASEQNPFTSTSNQTQQGLSTTSEQSGTTASFDPMSLFGTNLQDVTNIGNIRRQNQANELGMVMQGLGLKWAAEETQDKRRYEMEKSLSDAYIQSMLTNHSYDQQLEKQKAFEEYKRTAPLSSTESLREELLRAQIARAKRPSGGTGPKPTSPWVLTQEVNTVVNQDTDINKEAGAIKAELLKKKELASMMGLADEMLANDPSRYILQFADYAYGVNSRLSQRAQAIVNQKREYYMTLAANGVNPYLTQTIPYQQYGSPSMNNQIQQPIQTQQTQQSSPMLGQKTQVNIPGPIISKKVSDMPVEAPKGPLQVTPSGQQEFSGQIGRYVYNPNTGAYDLVPY